jgi:hypothetical protein
MKYSPAPTVEHFTKHQRVQARPATDGDRYGNVVHIGRKLIHVLMDRSNKVRKFYPCNLLPVETTRNGR